MTKTPQGETQIERQTADSSLPIRVFLFSDDRLLRDILRFAFKNQPRILLVGACQSLPNPLAEILGSGCDVLLVDPRANIGDFETLLVLASAKEILSDLRIVPITMDDGIIDLNSAIHSARSEGRRRPEFPHPASRSAV